jgi:hypothetical protein
MWAMAGATGCPKIKLGFRISVWDLPPLRLEEVRGGDVAVGMERGSARKKTCGEGGAEVDEDEDM